MDNSSQCKDALAEFLSIGQLVLLSVSPRPVLRLLYLSDCHHQPQRRVVSLFSHSRLLPPLFSCMSVDIIPSASTAQTTTTTPSSSSISSSINAQFISAVTRGDESYTRSLLARGSDVNATDAVGRSSVACVIAGERYAERAGLSPGLYGNGMLNAVPPPPSPSPQLADRRSFIYDPKSSEHPSVTC